MKHLLYQKSKYFLTTEKKINQEAQKNAEENDDCVNSHQILPLLISLIKNQKSTEAKANLNLLNVEDLQIKRFKTRELKKKQELKEIIYLIKLTKLIIFYKNKSQFSQSELKSLNHDLFFSNEKLKLSNKKQIKTIKINDYKENFLLLMRFILSLEEIQIQYLINQNAKEYKKEWHQSIIKSQKKLDSNSIARYFLEELNKKPKELNIATHIEKSFLEILSLQN